MSDWNGILPKPGLRLRIKNKIASRLECEGFLVKPSYLDTRKSGAVGTYKGWVPGCGGDVWWVEHDDKSVGAYLYSEVEPLLVGVQKTDDD